MNSMNPRVVVVDPVLCYVRNHRGVVSDRRLRDALGRHFADEHIISAYEQLRELLLASSTNDDEEIISSILTSNSPSSENDQDYYAEEILKIFAVCERTNFDLPEFAVTDLKRLPPNLNTRPSSLSIFMEDEEDDFRELLNEENLDENLDARLTRRLLARIVQELKQLKNMVYDLARTKTENENNLKNDEKNEIESSSSRILGKEDGNDGKEDRRNEPNRKRGSSRSTSSIEDAVAKIKAQRNHIFETENTTKISPTTPDVSEADAGIMIQKKPASIFGQFPAEIPLKNDGTYSPPRAMAALMEPLYLANVCRPDFASAFSLPSVSAGRTSEQFVTPTSAGPASAPIFGFMPDQQPQQQQQPQMVKKGPSKNGKKTVKSTISNAAEHQHQFTRADSESPSAADGDSTGELSNSVAGDSTDKPYACHYKNCHKRFTNKFLLKKHEFIHTGERPHTCPYCPKRFNRKDNALRHKYTHEDKTNTVVQNRRRARRSAMGGSNAVKTEIASPTASVNGNRQRSPTTVCPNFNASVSLTNSQQASELARAAFASAYTSALAASLWPRGSAINGVSSLNN